jgi:ubiquinone biosynthesis protein COQ4
MNTWNKISELMRARRAGMALGDLVVMKFALFSTPPSGINARLRSQGNSSLEVNMSELRALPDGSVGREYARILDQRGLLPLAISPSVKDRFADNPYALRYTTTHDLFHVLTGFPTTPAGELGLFAFMIAQGFEGGRRRLWFTATLYTLLLPLHARGIWHNVRVGLSMGEKAKALLEEPLEAYLAEPLDVVRRRVNLPDPASAGVAPGQESVLFNWLLPMQPSKPTISAA